MGKYYNYAIINGVVHVWWDEERGLMHQIMSAKGSELFLDLLNRHDTELQRALAEVDGPYIQPEKQP